jgi:hypothetical protein
MPWRMTRGGLASPYTFASSPTAVEAMTTMSSLNSEMPRTVSRIDGEGWGRTVCMVVTTGLRSSSRKPRK